MNPCCCYIVPRYRSTPHYRSRSLKMKSARFKKASEEIGVPRGKKSERYRSTRATAHEMPRHLDQHLLGCWALAISTP